MKVLVIKLTSMGDVIHSLPALTDAVNCLPQVKFDFVVEESFQEIPQWHQSVDRVIPIATRRWRKRLLSSRSEIVTSYRHLKLKQYDVVIDAQGLLKSAMIAKIAKGQRHGYDSQSIREPLASKLYDVAHPIDFSEHAISRIRLLFAKALGYHNHDAFQESFSEHNYGIDVQNIAIKPQEVSAVTKIQQSSLPKLVFLHGTTWLSKEWPTENWHALAKKLSSTHKILLPWGTQNEQQRANDIASNISNAEVLPRLGLSSLAHVLNDADFVVSVDTGLGHLSAALSKPTITIYGPTDVNLIGTAGKNQIHLIAEKSGETVKKNEMFDYGSVDAQKVFETIMNIRQADKVNS